MSLSKFQILLVEDSPTDAELFATALKQAAPRVRLYWVATPEEGTEYLRQEGRFANVGPVTLIVCDLNAGAMPAFDFIAQTKRQRATSKIPLVVYSGSLDQRDIERSYECGANSYIVKPMTMGTTVSQLRALVHYWLEIVKLPDPAASID
jgi:CheY-like chemotaxis protein